MEFFLIDLATAAIATLFGYLAFIVLLARRRAQSPTPDKAPPGGASQISRRC
jgi:hypothetical protein